MNLKTLLSVSSIFAIALISARSPEDPEVKKGQQDKIWLDTVNMPAYLHDFEKNEKWINMPHNVQLEKALLYDQHTLADEYPYKDTTRRFQWNMVKIYLNFVDYVNNNDMNWGVIQNYKNKNDRPPLAEDYTKNAYNMVADKYGVAQYQSIPFYTADDKKVPDRYGRDGSLVRLMTGVEDGFYKIINTNFEGEWYVPEDYVKPLEAKKFTKVVFIDRTNQNISVVENSGDKWLIRSMNPATTGLHRPPYHYETPLGIFVLQEKKPKMMYYGDGTTEIQGYAPYASRFTNGAYVHGVPINLPATAMVEFSPTLGTTPRSHMCVRNATSHAKFIYDWAPALESLIVVID